MLNRVLMDLGRFLRRLVVQPIGKTTTPRHNERRNDETTKQRNDERGNNKTTPPFGIFFLRPGGMCACALNNWTSLRTSKIELFIPFTQRKVLLVHRIVPHFGMDFNRFWTDFWWIFIYVFVHCWCAKTTSPRQNERRNDTTKQRSD